MRVTIVGKDWVFIWECILIYFNSSVGQEIMLKSQKRKEFGFIAKTKMAKGTTCRDRKLV